MAFPCKLCSAVPKTAGASLRHQVLHSMDHNFKFECPVETCSFSTPSFNYANKHFSVYHREARHEDPCATDLNKCSTIVNGVQCNFSTKSFWAYAQHLMTHTDNGIEVNCPFNECQPKRYFKKKTNLRSHLALCHPGWNYEGCPRQHRQQPEPLVRSSTSNIVGDEELHEEDSACNYEEFTFMEEDECDLLNDELVLDVIAKFYLELYGVHLLPYDTIQKVCGGLILISDIVQARMKLVLESELKKLETPQDKINEVCHKLKAADLLFTSHHKNSSGSALYSDYFRTEYFKKNFGYVPPREINLNEDDPDSDERQVIIPITSTLEVLFKDPSICKDIDESFVPTQEETTKEISNYTDGSQFLSEDHPCKEIHLMLYMDSLNAVMNPLGSAKNKFKLLTMYFTIGNLKPHHRSKIDSKHLAMIMREKVFKAVGPEVALEEVMTELKKLETEGIMYKGERVPVVVEFNLGDNLGQHLIGGFLESFSIEYFCRFCLMKRTFFKSNPTEVLPQRTVPHYHDCLRRAQAKSKKKHHQGVKHDCELNALKYFHATTHLVPCLGHDFFEGVVNWDLAGIINYFIKDKEWFSYELLNKRIKEFNCSGPDQPNKPAFVYKNGKKLGGHAVQNWTLLRILPYLIADEIEDFEDDGWQLYLKLKQLSEFFCMPSFVKRDMAYVNDVLIPAYFELRASVLDVSLYPLKPKHHFVVHYVRLMILYGPLIHVWTMPFEQKHKFFKLVMRQSKNFINPEFTCAVRNQLSACFKSSSCMFQDTWTEAKSKKLNSEAYNGELSNFLASTFPTGWRECDSVSFDGLEYSKGDYILFPTQEGPMGRQVPCGKVLVIVTKDSSLYLIVEELLTTFDEDLGIYTIPLDADGILRSVSPQNIKYPCVIATYFYHGKLTFSLKHAFPDSG